MCSRISSIAAAKAAVHAAGKGNGDDLPVEVRRSRPTGLNGCRRPKTSPTRHASTSFRSPTSARPHCGAKRATDLTSNRVRRTSAVAARGALARCRGGRRKRKPRRLFLRPCRLPCQLLCQRLYRWGRHYPDRLKNFRSNPLLERHGGRHKQRWLRPFFGFASGFAGTFHMCSGLLLSSRSSERRCGKRISAACLPYVAVGTRPTFGIRCGRNPATCPFDGR